VPAASARPASGPLAVPHGVVAAAAEVCSALNGTVNALGALATSIVAFDLFHSKDGTIGEHWGAQEAEAPGRKE